MAAAWLVCLLPVVCSRNLDRPGASYALGNKVFTSERLPTESIGTFALTLTGLVVGSSIRVETQAGALIEFRTATASTEVFSVGDSARVRWPEGAGILLCE